MREDYKIITKWQLKSRKKKGRAKLTSLLGIQSTTVENSLAEEDWEDMDN